MGKKKVVRKKKRYVIGDLDAPGVFGLTVIKVSNGFVIKTDEKEILAFESKDERDEYFVDAMKDVLYFILEYFISGSRYDRKRLRIVEEVGEKYTLQKDEKLVIEKIGRVVSKGEKETLY